MVLPEATWTSGFTFSQKIACNYRYLFLPVSKKYVKLKYRSKNSYSNWVVLNLWTKPSRNLKQNFRFLNNTETTVYLIRRMETVLFYPAAVCACNQKKDRNWLYSRRAVLGHKQLRESHISNRTLHTHLHWWKEQLPCFNTYMKVRQVTSWYQCVGVTAITDSNLFTCVRYSHIAGSITFSGFV